jgi:hypothetical protein
MVAIFSAAIVIRSQMPIPLSRRTALKTLSGALAGLPFERVVVAHPERTGVPLPLLGLIEGRFVDSLPLRAIGEDYFGRYPAESDLTRLCTLLLDGVWIESNHYLRDHLIRRAVQEFATGDIVLVGGWVLARSEARLLALASLVTKSAE